MRRKARGVPLALACRETMDEIRNASPYSVIQRDPTEMEDACARAWADKVTPDARHFATHREWELNHRIEYLGALQTLVGTGYTERYRAWLVESIAKAVESAAQGLDPATVVRGFHSDTPG